MPILMLVVLVAGLLQVAGAPQRPPEPRYPTPRRDAVVDDYHGVPVADPYRWLEQTGSSATAVWLREQDRLASAFLAHGAARDSVRQRLTKSWRREQVGVPWREGGRLFYEVSGAGGEQPVLYVQDDGLPAKVVLDPNRISRAGSVAFRDYAASADGRWLAYATARGGADASETRVRATATGRQLSDRVRGVLGSVCWTRDARGFFYIASTRNAGIAAADAAGVDKHLAYHVLGEPQAQDRRIGQWTNEYRWGYCMLSEDGRRAIVVAERGGESELSTIDLGSADHPAVAAPLVRRLGGGYAHTPIGTNGDALFLITNDHAPRRRIAMLNLADATPALREIVAESDDVIEDAALTSDRLVVHHLSDVKSRLRLFSLDGQSAGEVALPGIGAVGWGISARSSRPEFFYSFTSYLTPTAVYRYDRGTSVPFHAPTTLDVAAFETRQVFYVSKDGTRVPMFITARKDLHLDGRNPTLLTAYGGYGATTKPEFKADVLAWLQLGGVYAVANIRGGGEYGEAWHRAGMQERKQTSFDDFIAAAEYLVEAGVTSSSQLAIYGHSNGGLLVGAVLTQRPELFAVAVANAGHYDMLRYQRFTAGAGWIPEYGSSDDPSAFRVLRAYSPLHNVHAGTCYPATLLLAADHDDRVVPSHAYKFAAALQAAQACGRPVLLRVAHEASHSYASKNTQIAELSDMWGFIASQVELSVAR